MWVVRVGRKGRAVIPNKDVYEALNVREGSLLKIYVEGNRAIIEPAEDVVEKFKGSIKVDRWPEDLDEFLSEVLRSWLKGTSM